VQNNKNLKSESNITSFISEIYCPALEAPFRGLITPGSCTDERENIRRNTVCTYGCESGHYIAGGNQSLTCQIDGLWQGTVPYCKRKYRCAKLTEIEISYKHFRILQSTWCVP